MQAPSPFLSADQGTTRPDKIFRVAIAFDTHTSITHGVLAGIRQFERETRRWSLAMPGGNEALLADYLDYWRPHGLIGLFRTPLVERAMASGVDAVSLVSSSTMPENLKIYNDPISSAKIVADDLVRRQLNHVGLVLGTRMTPAIRERADAFERAAVFLGCTFCRYTLTRSNKGIASALGAIQGLEAWLKKQPRPIGLWAINDELGWQLLQACKKAGLRVPEDVAVIGYKNDGPICEFCIPTLSSLEIDQRRVGYEAASLLDRLMCGEPPPEEPIRVPPLGIVQRESSNTIAVDDLLIVQALSFIREYAHEGISVEDVLDHVPASASTLLRRFKKHLNRSPAQEIRRVRLEAAKYQLLSTNLPLAEIAADSGYGYLSQFCRDFKLAEGETPTEFRKRNAR